MAHSYIPPFEFPSKDDIPTKVYNDQYNSREIPFTIKKNFLTIYPVEDGSPQFIYYDKCGRRRGISYIYSKRSNPFYAVTSFIKDNAPICGTEVTTPIQATVDRVSLNSEKVYYLNLYLLYLLLVVVVSFFQSTCSLILSYLSSSCLIE